MNNSTKFHSYKVKDIVKRFQDKLLMVDDSYQRRSVWLTRDKIRLIETMLNEYLMPPLYLWDSLPNSDSGDSIQHIVDGQQRVSAIVEYIEGRFKLESSYLLLADEAYRYQDCYFADLPSNERSKIWAYELPAIDLRSDVTEAQIPNIFTRLNLTEYSLNNQERRHSGMQGLFADLSNKIAASAFWDDHNLFTAGDLRRMKDVEFCSSLILLARKGIIDQTSQKPLNEAYDDFKEVYKESTEDEEKIVKWMNILSDFISRKTRSFISKKTQLYSMFCLADYISSQKINITSDHIANFEKYVELYNAFKNSETDSENTTTHEIITTHKLAASEGIHKQKNRMLRFRALKSAVFNVPFRNEDPIRDK